MTVQELKVAIVDLPDELEIVIRCDWEEESPNGNCFNLNGVSVEDSHLTGRDFAAFDCDQDFDPDGEPV